MLYRKMPKTDELLSALGFGTMRLPVTLEGKIDEPAATKMLHHAIDQGVNYIDTAWSYHQGESENFVGQALQGRYRERVNLATKLPSWLIKNRQDMDSYLDQQLQRLQTDHIDYYLLHALDQERWTNLCSYGVLNFLESAVAAGKIRYVGFSFHDELTLFKKIVDAYNWTFCQIQYNFLDEEFQAGTAGLQYAAAKGLGVMVMEPLRGGKLTSNIPDDVAAAWAASSKDWTSAEWALRWVWNHPEVSVVLSGMSTLEQVQENLAVASTAQANGLTPVELETIAKVKAIYHARIKIPCTGCRYCLPCPNGVEIPECFDYYNSGHMFNNLEASRQAYAKFLGVDENAANCLNCGQCVKACPQGIAIPNELARVHKVLNK